MLAAEAVRSVYQPIVDLDSGAIVAVEALARGPEGHLHLPAALFAAAAREGVVAELEWACRYAALDGAACLPNGVSLFVNVEPSQLGPAAPSRLIDLETSVKGRVRVVLELTERELVRRPAEVLRAVYAARDQGWGIALDDVGVEPASLALMPVVRPDVVKLDMTLSQQRPDLSTARTTSAVAAYAEESGASVLAEGIETEEHLERAIALGATLGQGWYFGRPTELDRITFDGQRRLAFIVDAAATAPSPFALAQAHLTTRIARKSDLLAMSYHLERQTAALPAPPLLLAAFENATHFTPSTAARYARYAARSSLVAAFGVGLGDEPASGVRGAALTTAEPLAREWAVVVLSPHFAGALLALDLGDAGPDRNRRFEFAITHDRRLVTTAARLLVDRIFARS